MGSFLTRGSSVLLIAAAAVATTAGAARAELIAYEPFLTGTNRANNEYGPPVVSPTSQNDIRTFTVSGAHGLVDGAWAGSTSAYHISSNQDTDPNIGYEQGGSLLWNGSTDTTGFLRNARRGLKPYAADGTYYISAVLKRGSGASLDDALVGFTSDFSGGGLQGVFVGFEGDRGAAAGSPSLVLKVGDVNVDPATAGPATATQNINITDTNSTFNRIYTVVVKLVASATGPESVTYWVDDDVTATDWTSEETATATARYKNAALPLSVEAMSSLDAIDTIGFFSPNTSGQVWFDELRLGTTLADVTGAAVPEPGAAAALATAALLLGLRRRRRQS